jgi:hypothetical protein
MMLRQALLSAESAGTSSYGRNTVAFSHVLSDKSLGEIIQKFSTFSEARKKNQKH